MSAPLPVTVKTPLAKLSVPGAPIAPMSSCIQGDGSGPPSGGRRLNGGDTPSELLPAVSVTVTLMRACSLRGPGLFHRHCMAEAGNPVHSAIAVKVGCVSTSVALPAKTWNRAIGLATTEARQRIEYGRPITTISPRTGAVTKTLGGCVLVTVTLTESLA